MKKTAFLPVLREKDERGTQIWFWRERQKSRERRSG